MNPVQLENIFLNPTSFEGTPNEVGETKTTYNGNHQTQITASYMVFNISIEGLSPSMHSNLLFIVDKNRSFNSTAKNLSFTDDLGNSYTVTIPANGYSFDREQGNKERYTWNLELREVKE
mgnify:CR=1 FL=1